MKAIQVENLSKSYLVGHNDARAVRTTALRDLLARNAKTLARKTRHRLNGRVGQTTEIASFRPGRRNPGPWTVASQIHYGLNWPRCQADETERFCALNNITTTFNSATAVGLASRGGPGHSTGLNILSLITEPTQSRMKITGHVVSLCLPEPRLYYSPNSSLIQRRV